MSTAPSGELRNALRAHLLDGMLRKVKGDASGWKVLVVDREALRILAAAIPLQSLVDEGVTIVEMLDLRREPLPRLPAIYFITPTAESIQFVANEEASQYREFHIFFTSRLPDFQMNILKENPQLLRKVRSLVELNIQVLATESRVFSLDRPGASLPQLYGTAYGYTSQEAKDEMSLISERLAETCNLVAPNVEWTVRSDATSSTSRTVASLVKGQLETLRIGKQCKPDSPVSRSPVAAHSPRADPPQSATLIVLDRATDMISPLIHEFSYQAMAHDLLRLDYQKPGGAHYDIPDKDKPGKFKSIPIDDEDKDPVWTDIRHLFVEAALSKAQDSLREFLENDPAFKLRGKENTDVEISDMTAAVRALPESQMRADRHALHITALRECLASCAERRLVELAIAEQDLVIGRKSDGTRVHSEEIMQRLRTLLHDVSLPLNHRIRALLVALAVGDGSLALGGEASLLIMSSAFRSKLRKSDIAKIQDISKDLTSSIAGLQSVMSIARAASEALANKASLPPKKSATPGSEAKIQPGQIANKFRNRLKERRAHKQHEKATASRRKRQGLDNTDELPYEVARYIPPLRGVVADLVANTLDEAGFPTTGSLSVDSIISSLGQTRVSTDDESSSASSGSTSRSKIKPGKILSRAAATSQALSGAVVSSFTRQQSASSDDMSEGFQVQNADPNHLYVVFFVGGICYSEIRSVYEVCAKRKANIIVGGSQILTPKNFIRALAAVHDPVIRINVLLPPLPLELAQSRAAVERTLKAGAAIKETAPVNKAAASTPAVKSSRHSATESAPSAPSDAAYDRPESVEVVTGYKKTSVAKKLFGRRHK